MLRSTLHPRLRPPTGLGRPIRHLSTVDRCPPPAYDTGCTYCSPTFPPDKPIDHERNLNGTKVAPWKHVVVWSHGFASFADMPSKIELVPGSLAGEIHALKRGLFSPYHPVMVSNAILGGHTEVADGKQLVSVYPDGISVEFELEDTREFIKRYLVPNEPTEPVYNPFQGSGGLSRPGARPVRRRPRRQAPMVERRLAKDVVLICGHTQRDVRCGVVAPMIESEFVKVLATENIHDVDVGLISHVGGHAYAGNVIYFPRDPLRNVVWYGRVFPKHVQGIVQETIRGGRVIKELYRGEVRE